MYRVLLVEDEPLILEGLCMATPWARYGCTVAGKAYNAEEAERLIVELRPDIVITDINMPYLDGVELLRRLQEQYPDVELPEMTPEEQQASWEKLCARIREEFGEDAI